MSEIEARDLTVLNALGERYGTVKVELDAVLEDRAWLCAELRKAREDAERNARILAIVMAPGTTIRPSPINPGRTVIVNGLTGKDASELSPERAFASLLDEEDGIASPGRLSIGFAEGLPAFHVEHPAVASSSRAEGGT